jgi:hypothetical protein
MAAEAGPWLPVGWAHPGRVELGTGHHLRPVRVGDVDLELAAVLGSQERLWRIFGAARGWPPATLTPDQVRADLVRQQERMERRESFRYALVDVGETELLGCVQIDPPPAAGADADVWWWVVDRLVCGPVESCLAETVPRWIAAQWPRYVRPGPTPGEGQRLGEVPRSPDGRPRPVSGSAESVRGLSGP